MINAIIFDLGDVLINLEIQKSQNAFKKLGLHEFTAHLQQANTQYEIGAISEKTFFAAFNKEMPQVTTDDIRNAWNLIIGNFPQYRLDFLKTLSKNYRLFLLSNTDATHIANFKQKVGNAFYKEFETCFEKIYYSFEVGMRKPNTDIFSHVIQSHNLDVHKTLFIDDKAENIASAKTVDLKCWHLQVGTEDITDLFSVCKNIL